MSGPIMLALQAAGSLAAIGLVVGLARVMKLGGDIRIRDTDHARMLADEAICGFEPVDIGLDRARIGAILRDASGRILLVRRHGSHFAARQLASHAGVRLDRHFLSITTQDRSFGTVTLDLGPEAQAWAASLRRLPTPSASTAS
jgi:hypothetical protein